MKLLLAYALSLISLPTAALLVFLVTLPLLPFLKQGNKDLRFMFLEFFGSFTSACLALFFSRWVFVWLGFQAGYGLVLFISLVLAFYTAGCYYTKYGAEEIPSALGRAGGILLYVMLALWELPVFVWSVLMSLFLLVGVYLYRLTWEESYPFWSLVSQMPDEAFEWLEKKGGWIVLQNPKDPLPGPRDQFSGPFRLGVPRLGRTVYLYCHRDQLESSREEFMKVFCRRSDTEKIRGTQLDG
ncbi:MAG: hypothetical protein HYZ73_04370 [Elusimicrobia bacterium]|nr:hypothetical protein [Elusimicrobiota bacterium]